MTARLRTIAACDASAARQCAPWRREVEERAMNAWIALDRFTGLSAAEIRQERRALLEMADMIDRAMKAIEGDEA